MLIAVPLLDVVSGIPESPIFPTPIYIENSEVLIIASLLRNGAKCIRLPSVEDDRVSATHNAKLGLFLSKIAVELGSAVKVLAEIDSLFKISTCPGCWSIE